MTQQKLERWSLSKLRPYENNARVHSDEQIEQIAASIREFGFTNPILAAPDGQIIAGHGRYAAAQKLDLRTVPVLVVRDLSEEQIRALTLADNRLAELARWDDKLLQLELGELEEAGFDLSLIGFDSAQLENDADAEWKGMPEFKQEDKLWKRTIYVHFADDEAVEKFAELIGQTLTDKTKYVWFPAQERAEVAETRYASEQ